MRKKYFLNENDPWPLSSFQSNKIHPVFVTFYHKAEPGLHTLFPAKDLTHSWILIRSRGGDGKYKVLLPLRIKGENTFGKTQKIEFVRCTVSPLKLVDKKCLDMVNVSIVSVNWMTHNLTLKIHHEFSVQSWKSLTQAASFFLLLLLIILFWNICIEVQRLNYVVPCISYPPTPSHGKEVLLGNPTCCAFFFPA